MSRALEDPLLDVGEEEARLGDDEREQQDRVAQLLLGQPRGVGVLQVVQQPEELEEHLRRLPPVRGVGDPADDPAHRPVADAVVDRLELLVDEHRHEVAAPHLAEEDLAHRLEGRVRQARQLHHVEEEQVQVPERLPHQGERRLGGRVADELLDVGVEALLDRQARLDVAVEAREVHGLLGQDRARQAAPPA